MLRAIPDSVLPRCCSRCASHRQPLRPLACSGAPRAGDAARAGRAPVGGPATRSGDTGPAGCRFEANPAGAAQHPAVIQLRTTIILMIARGRAKLQRNQRHPFLRRALTVTSVRATARNRRFHAPRRGRARRERAKRHPRGGVGGVRVRRVATPGPGAGAGSRGGEPGRGGCHGRAAAGRRRSGRRQGTHHRAGHRAARRPGAGRSGPAGAAARVAPGDGAGWRCRLSPWRCRCRCRGFDRAGRSARSTAPACRSAGRAAPRAGSPPPVAPPRSRCARHHRFRRKRG